MKHEWRHCHVKDSTLMWQQHRIDYYFFFFCVGISPLSLAGDVKWGQNLNAKKKEKTFTSSNFHCFKSHKDSMLFAPSNARILGRTYSPWSVFLLSLRHKTTYVDFLCICKVQIEDRKDFRRIVVIVTIFISERKKNLKRNYEFCACR